MNEAEKRDFSNKELKNDPQLKTFIPLLNKIRDCSINDRFTSAQKILEYLGYKDIESLYIYQMDAFLIKSILICFDKDIRIKKDIALMAFGLLKGYFYEDMPGIGERRNKYIEESEFKPKRSKKNYDDNFRKTNEDKIILELANYLFSLKNISKYVNDINEYVEQISKNTYRAKLPIPSFKLLQAGSRTRELKDIEQNTIDYYINFIRFSKHHDEIAKQLYVVLCGQKKPPYDKWVATWLLKCIQEKFKDTIDKDIMLASFALTPNYKLGGGEDGLKRRLNEYILRSIYYDTHPCKSRDPIDKIWGPRIAEATQIMDKLETREQRLVDELVKYIKEDIPDYQEHIKDLGNYGKLTDGEGHSYRPYSPELFFSRENIKLSPKMHKANITPLLSAIALICGLFCILVSVYTTIYKGQFQRELNSPDNQVPIKTDQGEVQLSQSVKGRDDSFCTQPDYAKELENFYGSISENK